MEQLVERSNVLEERLLLAGYEVRRVDMHGFGMVVLNVHHGGAPYGSITVMVRSGRIECRAAGHARGELGRLL